MKSTTAAPKYNTEERRASMMQYIAEFNSGIDSVTAWKAHKLRMEAASQHALNAIRTRETLTWVREELGGR
jgi:hypothetical protein